VTHDHDPESAARRAPEMAVVNALVELLHNLGCSFEVSTVMINGRADLWEWKATWTRTLSLPGYSRPFSPLGARAPTLAGVLRAVLDFEAKFDADERARLAAREEVPGGEASND
jgi:hypothetical protein